MRARRAVRRRREAERALARSDLPASVRHLLSAPEPPGRLPWRVATYTVLDLETSGLDPASDAIVAAGGLRVVGGRAQAASAFRLLVRPDRAVPPAAVRVHGLLPQELEAAPPLATQLEALAVRIAGDVLVVHVAAVDRAFLDAAMRRTWGCPLPAVVLDTARMAAWLERRLRLARPPGRHGSWRLADLARANGLPVHPEHDPCTTRSPPPSCSWCWRPGWSAMGWRPSASCAGWPGCDRWTSRPAVYAAADGSDP